MNLGNIVKKCTKALLVGMMAIKLAACSPAISLNQERVDYLRIIRDRISSERIDIVEREGKKVTISFSRNNLININLADGVVRDLSSKLAELTPKQFEHFKEVTTRAYFLSGIRHPQRYFTHPSDLTVLEESNANLTDPGRRRGEPLALFFLSTYDFERTLFGIRALEVKAPLIKDFTKAYKVIVFEAGNVDERVLQVKKLSVLYPYKNSIGGITIGAHGSLRNFNGTKYGLIDLGPWRKDILIAPDVRMVFSPLTPMMRKDALVFLATCGGGEGREREQNMANAFAYTFPGIKAYACDESMLIDFHYSLTLDGKFDPDSLKMYGRFGLLRQCNYVARCSKGDAICRIEDLVKKTGMPANKVIDMLKVNPKSFGAQFLPLPFIVGNYLIQKGASIKTVEDLAHYIGDKEIAMRILEASVSGFITSRSISFLVRNKELNVEAISDYCAGKAGLVDVSDRDKFYIDRLVCPDYNL